MHNNGEGRVVGCGRCLLYNRISAYERLLSVHIFVNALQTKKFLLIHQWKNWMGKYNGRWVECSLLQMISLSIRIVQACCNVTISCYCSNGVLEHVIHIEWTEAAHARTSDRRQIENELEQNKKYYTRTRTRIW